MVLPTLHSYSASKHLTTPEQIVQTKQEIETEKKIEKTQTRLNSAQSKWASPIAGTLNDEALRIEQTKQEKLKRLEQRRSHLSTVLEAEKNQYQNEITSFRQSSRESKPEIKNATDSFRSAREKERPTTANDTSDEYRLPNNLNLHSIEQQTLENLQLECWSKPKDERCFRQEEEEEEEKDLHPRLDEYDKQNERKQRIVQLKMILQQQMDEIKQKEEESELLKQEEEHLLKEQYQLDQYEEERKQMENRYVQQDSGRQLLRQHKAKLHKRAKEIQEQLEFDMKLVASIAYTDRETRLEQSDQYKQLKRNAMNMLKQLKQQIQVEKEREQELHGMFQEEVAKQWSSREQEWNHEKESREKLIRQIIDQRQEQIMDNLQTIKRQQEETYEKQRSLINDMEQTRKYHLIVKQKQAKEEEEEKNSTKISFLQQEREQSKLELEKKDTIQHDYNKQKDLITTTTVEPKFYGRRRVNWN